MAAVPEDLETQLQLRDVSTEATSADHHFKPGDPDVKCSEDGTRCLSREEVRAISRRVIAERQRMIALLSAYDSQPSGPPSPDH